jgi:hypothetical protein
VLQIKYMTMKRLLALTIMAVTLTGAPAYSQGLSASGVETLSSLESG